MSKLVAFAAIQGGYNIVSQVEGEYKMALERVFPTPPIFCR
jgi:acetyl-CoA synthase